MKNLELVADEELVNLYKTQQDTAIIGVLYKRYYHLVLGTCIKKLNDREQAKDETMVIFEKLPLVLMKHDVQRFNHWIYSIATNACISRLRKNQTQQRRSVSMPEDVDQLADTSDYEEVKEKELKADLVRWAVGQLASEQATCISLFYYENKSYKEIAQITGLEEGAVKSHLQNGKRNLKILLSTKTRNE